MKREHYRSGRISLSRPLEVVNDISLDDGDTLARLLSLELDTISVTEFVLVCYRPRVAVAGLDLTLSVVVVSQQTPN